ncbi:MAG: hypothetical protein V2A34_00945 [Lentisphaerota bacterium]
MSTAPSDYVRYDARFQNVRDVRHSYVEWITPDLLLVTSHGADGKEFKFSKMFLLRLKGLREPPEIIDLSGAVETLARKTGKDFCSGDAILSTHNTLQ